MRTLKLMKTTVIASLLCALTPVAGMASGVRTEYQDWLLPEQPAVPADNKMTAERIGLGRALFFETRLSKDGNMSCASCHNPSRGWSDGLPTGHGHRGQVLGRATPTIVNAAFNKIQMWDGRKRDLEDQAMGPMEAQAEMHSDFDAVFSFLNSNARYREMFEKAYPGEGISKNTLAKAIASFERTVVSRDTPFDRWVRGDDKAMTASQLRGMQIFMDEKKGNCAACHSAPNFTDDGFHNIGLASYGNSEPDLGRYKITPIRILKGAFKTPSLRGVEFTAPYFHDGSAATLMDVVEHYARGGDVKTDLSSNIKALDLSMQEKRDLVAFMRALSEPGLEKAGLPNVPVLSMDVSED
jgi:cytochrome c peroxidase